MLGSDIRAETNFAIGDIPKTDKLNRPLESQGGKPSQ